MTHRYRQLGATAIAAGCALCIAACGSSSNSSPKPSTASGGRAQPVALTLSSSQRACLKTHGVTLPTRGTGRGGPTGSATGTGAPPQGGTPPAGRRPGAKRGGAPAGGRGPGGGGFGGLGTAKTQKAFRACGVDTGRGAGGGAPPSGTATGG